MVLNDDEMKNIKAKYKDTNFGKVLNYGSSDGKRNNYMCPRYWCTRVGHERPLTETEALSGICGKIRNSDDNADKGEVVEFKKNHYAKRTHDKYIMNTPGLSTRHNNVKLCVPCCFKKEQDSDDIKNKFKLCGKATEETDANQVDKIVVTTESTRQEEKNQKKTSGIVVVGPERNLDPGKWGYIPIALQTMFAVVGDVHKKNGKPSLLVYGVSRTDSFMACIANIHVDFHQITSEFNSKNMREAIVSFMNEGKSIDKFMSYQNGNLVEMFKPAAKYTPKEFRTKLGTTYKNKYTALPCKGSSEQSDDYMGDVIGAFESFQKYVLKEKDPDYTYLWDIVCEPGLFEDGLNLVVFELPNNDFTNNVNVICPSNHLSNHKFDNSKSTLFLIKNKDNSYSPIKMMNETENKIEIRHLFSLATTKHKNVKRVLNMISRLYEVKCSPDFPKNKKYNFVRPIGLRDLINAVSPTYEVGLQIVNYDSKVVGVLVGVKKPGRKYRKYYVPCYPSGLMRDKEYTFIDDFQRSYHKTVSFLTELHEKTNIPCKPEIKLIDSSGFIFGILTNSNQLVPVTPISPDEARDQLKEHRDLNYFESDMKSMHSADEDVDAHLGHIHLETQFYNAFRLTVKTSIHENKSLRKQIVDIFESSELLYDEQIDRMKPLLQQSAEGRVVFEPYDETIDFRSVTKCMDDVVQPYCDAGKLHVPDKNLFTGKPNESTYYDRLSDELIRYKQIREFILKKDTHLQFQETRYVVASSEVILSKSMIDDYYKKEKLVEAKPNRNVTYDNAVQENEDDIAVVVNPHNLKFKETI